MFAGQRLDGFYVDLGAVFDLAVLRPFQNLHLIPTPAGEPVNAVRSFNVHTIAIQVPIKQLTRDGSVPKKVDDAKLIFDCDPRHVTQVGNATQNGATAPATSPAPPPKKG